MQPKRVLIVDDEMAVTMTLAVALEKLGEDYIVETANDGAEALAKLKEGAWSLLITDYKMPGMDGLDLAQAAKALLPDIHIVMMTAYGSEAMRQTAQRIGVEEYFDKPFNVNKIREMIACEFEDTCEGNRVLILEDTDDLRRLYTRALERGGYEVQSAATLEEARALLAVQHFDAFVCDVHIGRDRGTDLLREQADELRCEGTQIIMVSADPRYRAESEEMGVEFYMEKPVDIITLVTLLNRLISHNKINEPECEISVVE